MTYSTQQKIEKAIARFEEEKPKTISDITAMGFKVTYKGDGLYREVFKLDGYPLVVKVPRKQYVSQSIRHSVTEVKTIKRINRLKKYKRLAKYMPDIHYFDPRSGMMLMRYYTPVHKKYRQGIVDLLTDVTELIWPYAKNETCDLHSSNIGMGDDGPVIIDLGYFAESGHGDEWW